MHLRNSYYYYQGLLTPEICKKIINYGLNQIKDEESRGIDTSGITFDRTHKGGKRNRDISFGSKTVQQIIKEYGKEALKERTFIRDSNVTFLDIKEINDIVWPIIHRGNYDAGWNFDIDFMESLQFTVYKPGQFYGWHSDGGSDKFSAYKKLIPGVRSQSKAEEAQYVPKDELVGKVRKISATINLNLPGEYEGGNLKFDFGDHTTDRYHEVTEIRPQGSIIVFPSFLKHQVTPVTKGTRYSLVAWTVGRPFR